jgi:hypothetical protein
MVKWPWMLPPREDVAERVARAREVRAQAKCLLEQIERAIGNTEQALGGGGDDERIRGGGETTDER